MTLEEIRAAREAAEQEILAIMREFREKTGLAIVGCDVRTTQESPFGCARLDRYTISVRLALENI